MFGAISISFVSSFVAEIGQFHLECVPGLSSNPRPTEEQLPSLSGEGLAGAGPGSPQLLRFEE